MPPMLGRGVRAVASDRRFRQFLAPGQQPMHSLPTLRHLQWIWGAFKQVANRVQLQHLGGLLNVVRRWRWRALGLMEVSDKVGARWRLICSVGILKIRSFLRIPPYKWPNLYRWQNNSIHDGSIPPKSKHQRSAALHRQSRGRVRGGYLGCPLYPEAVGMKHSVPVKNYKRDQKCPL
jgi:hypothetical protein